MYSKFNCDISNYFYNDYINQLHMLMCKQMILAIFFVA